MPEPTERWEFENRQTPRTPKLIRLLDYWRARCRNGHLPSRPDIEPGQLIFVLSNVYLVDVRPGVALDRKYSFRLFGTALVELMGHEFTKKFPHDVLAPSGADAFITFCESVTASREPRCIYGPPLFSSERHTRSFEFCQMPLEDQTGAVTLHLGGLVPDED